MLGGGHRVSKRAVGGILKTIPFFVMSWLWIACADDEPKNVMVSMDSEVESADMTADSEMVQDGFVDEMGTVWLPPPETPERPTCDDDHVPIVMAHGFLAAGDTWSPHRRRFIANGVCPDRIYAFDWNSLDQAADHPALLGAFIESVLAEHNVTQVDLIGHSAGGRLGYDYLSVPRGRQTVRRYVHVGSFPNDRLPGPEDVEPVPTLNLWSEADLVVEGGDIPGATNVRLPDADHYAVATSDDAFTAVYEFLNGEPPETTALPQQDPAIVNGRFRHLAKINLSKEGKLKCGRSPRRTGVRLRPAQRFDVSADGHFVPLIASANERYEFVGRGGDPNGVAVRHFFEPFVGDKSLAYVRGFPGREYCRRACCFAAKDRHSSNTGGIQCARVLFGGA